MGQPRGRELLTIFEETVGGGSEGVRWQETRGEKALNNEESNGVGQQLHECQQ